jgi:hypothetical protein
MGLKNILKVVKPRESSSKVSKWVYEQSVPQISYFEDEPERKSKLYELRDFLNKKFRLPKRRRRRND